MPLAGSASLEKVHIHSQAFHWLDEKRAAVQAFLVTPRRSQISSGIGPVLLCGGTGSGRPGATSVDIVEQKMAQLNKYIRLQSCLGRRFANQVLTSAQLLNLCE